MEYVAAPSGFYKAFFNNIVGVSREKNSEGIQDVMIRSQSKYIHELVKSKKFHYSQKETIPFGAHKDGTYGEFTLRVEWNRELKGKILTFGQELVVTAPESLVKSIRESVSVLWKHYKCQELVPIEKEP
jgi:predicted DNA-binding transcriptional regulator YafY